MANHKVKCEVVSVVEGTTCQKVGDTFTIWKRTPAGICCRAFAAIYPHALALRFADHMDGWETDGHVDVTCPDGHIKYRLSRDRD